MTELQETLIKVGEFCSRTQFLKPIKSVSPGALEVKSSLMRAIELIKGSLPEETLLNLDFYYSKGAIFYPKVPWISIITSGNLPKKNLSTTICFARNGEGLVCGVLLPSMRPLDYGTINRTTSSKFIDVNGTNTPTKYNNNFVNPVDIYFSEFSEEKLKGHIVQSIALINFLESSQEM
jgi:hypothetical protein